MLIELEMNIPKARQQDMEEAIKQPLKNCSEFEQGLLQQLGERVTKYIVKNSEITYEETLLGSKSTAKVIVITNPDKHPLPKRYIVAFGSNTDPIAGFANRIKGYTDSIEKAEQIALKAARESKKEFDQIEYFQYPFEHYYWIEIIDTAEQKSVSTKHLWSQL